MNEKRKGPRIPLQVWAATSSQEELRLWLDPDEVPEDFSFCYSTKDLSAFGVFLETATPLSSGTKMEIELPIPAGAPLRVRGRVVRVVPRDDTEGRVPGMGIEFEPLDGADEARIRSLLASVHRR